MMATEYGFTKDHILYKLTLPDVLNYVGARNERITRQNEAQSGATEREETHVLEAPTVSQIAHFFGGGMTM